MLDLSKSYEFFKPDAKTDRIHIIGCGSVGSTVAENLARCGVKNMTLWDFDVVEPHNIVNQMFRQKDVGRPKAEALRDLLCEIDPDLSETVQVKPDGWKGERLSGYVFLAADSMEVRRAVVEKHFDNLNVKAMFDFRTLLTGAQHFAADWMDLRMKQDLQNSMQFSDDEAAEETPVSACGVTLGVAPTVRVICALGVANFMNFWNGKRLKKLILVDAYDFHITAF